MPRRAIKVHRIRERVSTEIREMEFIYDPEIISLEDIVDHYDEHETFLRSFLQSNNIEYLDDNRVDSDDNDVYQNRSIEVIEDEEIPDPVERKIPWL